MLPGRVRRHHQRGEQGLAETPVTEAAADRTRAADTLKRTENTWANRFALILALMIAGLLISLLWGGGDPQVKRVFAVTLAATLVTMGIFFALESSVERYSPARALIVLAVGLSALFAAQFYFGVHSGAIAILLIAIYFFASSSSRRAAIVAYVVIAALHALCALLVDFDVIADRGIIRHVEPMGPGRAIVSVLQVQALLLFVFLIGRTSRSWLETAVGELDRALDRLSQREALLEEANLALERALEVGGRGRWGGESMGRWKLGALIGRGGMGEVYEAVDDGGERAAIKLLYPDQIAKPALMGRFVREGEVLSAIDHPNVVAIHEVGTDGGIPYLAMERLSGTDLAAVLRHRRRLPIDEVVELARQVAGALEAASAAGVVHRDLKPQNIFVCGPDGRPSYKVLDFGVSKLSSSSGTLTGGAMVGTPHYMAPEQASTGEVDHRADVFSLAVICYRALTGRPAFSGDNRARVLFQVVYVQPQRPSDLAAIGADVELALALGLAKDPEQRFARASELAAAIADAAAEKLGDGVRQRARALLASQPWGAKIG